MIVVTTPNGNTGKHVLRALVERGETVRAISYRPELISADLREKCEIVVGSPNDAEVLTRGFAGAESVFWCVPTSNQWDDGAAYYGAFTDAATAALAANGNAARLVAIGSGGYGAKNAGFMTILAQAEDTLNTTGVPTRHLRCGYFMENVFWFMQSLQTQNPIFELYAPDAPIPWVAAQDIAAVAVRSLCDRDWRDQSAIPVYGAADMSMNEAAVILSEVLQTPVRYAQSTDAQTAQVLRQFHSGEGFIEASAQFARAVSAGEYGRDKRVPEGTTPTTLREWAMQYLLPVFRS
ncbi:MAG: NAD(P)H-binding protein [Armatimonadetes bacterium]|nr:NAD(P)H-binding protein [Armatimonadota bacterium]